jgi:hypothetical protein
VTNDAPTDPLAGNPAPSVKIDSDINDDGDQSAGNPAPPAESAAAHGRPAPPAPTCDPLVSMLTFLQAIGGDFRLKIDERNAQSILEEMRRERPNISRTDMVFGAQVAASIASQMRALEWRMRGARSDPPDAPKKKRKRKAATAEAPAAIVDADGGAKVIRRPGETMDEAAARTAREAFGVNVRADDRR